MKTKTVLETIVLSAALVLIPVITRAALYEDSRIVEGIVMAVADGNITLTTKSKDGDQIQEINVKAQDQTKFEDVTLAELKEGDRIKVEYHEDQDIKAADSIAKVQP